MRPAQIAREIVLNVLLGEANPLPFNEARANCAGNFKSIADARAADSAFNEARANCAGNWQWAGIDLCDMAALQ